MLAYRQRYLPSEASLGNTYLNPIHKRYSKDTLEEIITYSKRYKGFHTYIICDTPKETLKVFYDIPQDEMSYIYGITIRNDIGYIDLWFENHSSIRIVTYSPYLSPLNSNAVLECWSVKNKPLDLSGLRPYNDIQSGE